LLARLRAAGLVGVALLVLASAAGIRGLLGQRVDDLGTAGRDTSFGFGRVNLCKAAGGSCAYPGGG
jgi:hypothetical protein